MSTTGEALRDAGITQVMEPEEDFNEYIVNYVKKLPPGTEVTGEEIRLKATRAAPLPHHSNAWGGVIAGLVKKGILVDTGRTQHSVLPSNHHRRCTLWAVTHPTHKARKEKK